MDFITIFLVSLALSAVAYMIAPKPSIPSPAVQELNLPTAESGKPKNVVFGEVLVKSPNYLWYGCKSQAQRKSDNPLYQAYYSEGDGGWFNGQVLAYPGA